jgi:hypothetical protein
MYISFIRPSDLNQSSKVVVKVFDMLEPEGEDGTLIGEADVDVTDVFKVPFDVNLKSLFHHSASRFMHCYRKPDVIPLTEQKTYLLKKPNTTKHFGKLSITLDPVPGRKVLADRATATTSSTVEQVQAAVETNLASAEYYKKFGVVLDYLDKFIQITGQIASVCYAFKLLLPVVHSELCGHYLAFPSRRRRPQGTLGGLHCAFECHFPKFAHILLFIYRR